MNITKKIKVLVVDDSYIFREVISRGISTDPYIDVVATAMDPFDARDKIIEFEPDVMTLDVEMPKMNGIEFLRKLLPQYPLPTIVVSTMNDSVFDAMNAGAVEFVGKPNVNDVNGVENFINEMILKIKIASKAEVSAFSSIKNQGIVNDIISRDIASKIIAIGASTGGTEAIYNILKRLPKTVPGIVIVQHIPAGFSKMFAERLDRATQLYVKEAESSDYVEQGKVLIAPGDRHMKIVKVGDRYKVQCFTGDKVNGHCPSVDILFESVAMEAGKNALGIILTGMGYDGAKGMLSMKRKGAKTLGQDEKSCVVYGMPKSAYEIGAVEKQASLEDMPGDIIMMLNRL